MTPPLKAKQAFFRKTLRPYFTKVQVNAYLRGKWSRLRNWSQTDVSRAITLKSLSRRAFLYAKDTLKIPMPCERGLRRYFQEFKIEDGHLDNVLELAAAKAKTLRPEQKAVKLNFDAVHYKVRF